MGGSVGAGDAASTFAIAPDAWMPRRSDDHDDPVERAQRAQSVRNRHPHVPVGAEKA